MPPQAATTITPPPTLPADFSGFDDAPKPSKLKPPPTLPANFTGFDDASTQLNLTDEQLKARAHNTAGSTPGVEDTVKEILGHINEAASLGAGRNASEMWQTAKSKYQALRSHLAGGTGSDPISAVTDWIGEQIDNYGQGVAKYSPDTDLGKRALATVPVVGSTAADIINDLERKDYASAALKTGKSTLSGVVASQLPKIKEKVTSATSRAASVIKPPPDVAAGTAYENAVAPGGLSAADQAAMRSDWQRARKYIGKQTESAPIPKGEGAAMRAAATTRKAANELWQTHVEPVIEKFADESASTSDVAQRIRATPSEIDIASRPGIVKKIDRLASVFDRDMTIKEMNAKVMEMNADPAINKFYEMSGADRAQALKADPTLDGKVAALDGLRETMFDTISSKWSDEGGALFREARKDYGALRNVEQSFREAKVPTPKSLATRIANTARVTLSPRTATEYLRSPISTVFDMNNPNRLAAKAVNKAGKVGEAIPPPPPLPLYSRPAGPAAAQAIPPPPVPTQLPVGAPPPLEFPPTTPNTMWSGTQPKAGFEQPSKMVSSLRPPENVKGPSITAAEGAGRSPARGIVGNEFKKLKLTNLLTPRQQTTLETLINGPRYKGMDSVDREAAIRSVLTAGKP